MANLIVTVLTLFVPQLLIATRLSRMVQGAC